MNQPLETFVGAGSEGMLSILSPWLFDETVSEIMVNRPYEVFVESKGRIERHAVEALSPLYLKRMFAFIANESNQMLNEKSPLLSANLYNGARVQLAIPPVSLHYALSIRKQSIKTMTLLDYQQSDFFDMACPFDFKSGGKDEPKYARLLSLYQERQWGQFLKEAILMKKNIVISGGTSSGKTTFLNALLNEIPLDERIITLEDAREVQIPHENSLSLLALKKEQGAAKVSMQDLVQCCLRLRPDRIIMGEIKGAEILDFLSACSTGHEGSVTSIHANNPRVAFMRMTQMYKLNNVPSMKDADILKELHEIIDVIVQVGKVNGKRQVQSIYFKECVTA